MLSIFRVLGVGVSGIMGERSDKLLRGSRKERVETMLSLTAEEWDLNTLLNLYLGILDHAEDVRMAAMDALMEIATRSPEPFTVSPISMLIRYMFDFTVASGYTPYMFRSLVQLGTPEAIQAAEIALRHVERNEDFGKFLDILIEEGKSEVLRNIDGENLSKQKTRLLRDALDGIEHDDGSELS
ncbi:hypothetical protein ACFL6S_36825 [Candidatus Poribacteria bacterium]